MMKLTILTLSLLFGTGVAGGPAPMLALAADEGCIRTAYVGFDADVPDHLYWPQVLSNQMSNNATDHDLLTNLLHIAVHMNGEMKMYLIDTEGSLHDMTNMDNMMVMMDLLYNVFIEVEGPMQKDLSFLPGLAHGAGFRISKIEDDGSETMGVTDAMCQEDGTWSHDMGDLYIDMMENGNLGCAPIHGVEQTCESSSSEEPEPIVPEITPATTTTGGIDIGGGDDVTEEPVDNTPDQEPEQAPDQGVTETGTGNQESIAAPVAVARQSIPVWMLPTVAGVLGLGALAYAAYICKSKMFSGATQAVAQPQLPEPEFQGEEIASYDAENPKIQQMWNRLDQLEVIVPTQT